MPETFPVLDGYREMDLSPDRQSWIDTLSARAAVLAERWSKRTRRGGDVRVPLGGVAGARTLIAAGRGPRAGLGLPEEAGPWRCWRWLQTTLGVLLYLRATVGKAT
jgi:hypothetical protein